MIENPSIEFVYDIVVKHIRAREKTYNTINLLILYSPEGV